VKIALVGPSITQRGGVASVLIGLQQYLERNGIGVVLVPTTGARSTLGALLIFVRAILLLVRNCSPGGCDVIHIHMASRGSCLRKSLLALICFLFRKPYILHLHGAEFREFYRDELGNAGRALVNFVFRKAAFVVALSGAWQEWVESTIRDARTVVVFNGVDMELPARTQIRSGKTILFLGRVGERKGVGELIAALRQMSGEIADVTLEIGGDGDLQRYQKEAADLANVRFLGWLGERERAAALQRATLFCLPSWNEGLPMSVLEAMSVGLPVVSTPVGGIPEAVIEGETGLLVLPGNVEALAAALVAILSDPKRAEAMGKNGQRRQRTDFSVQSMGDRLVSLYRQCVDSGSSAA
jgi:glycosyltransferase involved in cell wall biosynthesis